MDRQTCRSAVLKPCAQQQASVPRDEQKGGSASARWLSKLLFHLCFNVCLNVDLHNMFQLFSLATVLCFGKTVFLQNTGSLGRDPSRHGRVSSASMWFPSCSSVSTWGSPHQLRQGCPHPPSGPSLPLSEPGGAILSQNLSQTPQSFTAPLGVTESGLR